MSAIYIIDKLLNTGMNDIHCLRIIDIINMAKNGQISLSRKSSKLIWVISGKNKDDFDLSVWPILWWRTKEEVEEVRPTQLPDAGLEGL